MLLNSTIANIVWTKLFNEIVELNIGTQDLYQTNTNLGSRTIIPDAKTLESSVFTYEKLHLKQLVIEAGLRYDFRSIQTFTTGTINTDPTGPGYKITPFLKQYDALNGALGLCFFDKSHFSAKVNFSTGYRSGNLAELSSNGLHEGTYRYEIGNTNLKIEQNICSDIMLSYKNRFIDLSAAAYYNRFLNYIYLAPSNTEYIGFQIFNYLQQNATIKGTELTADVHPGTVSFINWITSYSYVDGILDNGTYLPFIAAPKLNSDLKISFKNSKKINELAIKPGITYVFKQDRPGDFETETAAYYLLNMSASLTIKNPKNSIQISVSANNLLNNAYYDHLSRFKYYNIYNTGRNISLNFKITI
jgi:iron complex outermembrane receptor protein